MAYCDLRLQVFLHDIVVHHEAAADVGDDGVRLMKTEVFVDFDGVKILFVDGEIDCGELFRLTERFDEIERAAKELIRLVEKDLLLSDAREPYDYLEIWDEQEIVPDIIISDYCWGGDEG